MNRPPYDRFMLRFHHFLKEKRRVPAVVSQRPLGIRPGSSWILFTHTTSHACLSGQYVLEQTVIVRHESLVYPEKAPITVLGELAGFPLRATLARAA